ncbi:type 1 glutamine amidotransferase domain-containing protein [Streptomyces lydicus]|uniref:type 1 glutamine amidotransferase domain-containing protein n=1 Tax=Streptomyces lydicus TaxID=47763 RepID=UPI0036FA3356
MTSVLMMLSAATELPLTDGSCRTAGFWPEEVVDPEAVFAAAGISTVLATPEGAPAGADPAGLTPEGTGYSTERCAELIDAVEALRPRYTTPVPLASVDVERFDAVFIPGGYGPLADLWADPDCGRVLSEFHRSGKPIAAVCHGPAALLSSMDVAGEWLFSGYEMTSFTDEEEADLGVLDLIPWTAEGRLVKRGARFVAGPPWGEHLVRDRALLTGQNPASARPLARVLCDIL